MKIKPTQINKIKYLFNTIVESIDSKKVKEAVDQGDNKMENVSKNLPEVFKGIWGKVEVMFGMVKDYSIGDYKEIPWKIIASVTGSIIYFVMPIDVIPDVIIGFGYIDDVMVFRWVVKLAAEDIRKYEEWKKLNN